MAIDGVAASVSDAVQGATMAFLGCKDSLALTLQCFSGTMAAFPRLNVWAFCQLT